MESTERKMKKIQESKNFPTTYETVMQQQKRRESLKTYRMQNSVSIWRNRGQEDEMHMTVLLDDQDYKRLQEIVRTEHLPSTEAYDKMVAEKKQKNDKRCH